MTNQEAFQLGRTEALSNEVQRPSSDALLEDLGSLLEYRMGFLRGAIEVLREDLGLEGGDLDSAR